MALSKLYPVIKSINLRFRKNRFKLFKKHLSQLNTEQTIRILDIGGTESYWKRLNFPNEENVHITLLNLKIQEVHSNKFESIVGDACNLPFPDNHFHIVFSNSVIEHLFCKNNQKKMADEVRRVGQCYYVQTPNRYFPIEPHWFFPFFQFLPFKIKVYLTMKYNLGNYRKASCREDAVKRVQEVVLLTENEMKSLFPEAKNYREYFLGLKKSITMYHFPKNKNQFLVDNLN